MSQPPLAQGQKGICIRIPDKCLNMGPVLHCRVGEAVPPDTGWVKGQRAQSQQILYFLKHSHAGIRQVETLCSEGFQAAVHPGDPVLPTLTVFCQIGQQRDRFVISLFKGALFFLLLNHAHKFGQVLKGQEMVQKEIHIGIVLIQAQVWPDQACRHLGRGPRRGGRAGHRRVDQ